jgi:homoserine O-acetyltransferase
MTEFIPTGSRFIDLPSPFAMKRGGALHGARMAYETWGRLDADAGNAILILTGLSRVARRQPGSGLVGSDARPG